MSTQALVQSTPKKHFLLLKPPVHARTHTHTRNQALNSYSSILQVNPECTFNSFLLGTDGKSREDRPHALTASWHHFMDSDLFQELPCPMISLSDDLGYVFSCLSPVLRTRLIQEHSSQT